MLPKTKSAHAVALERKAAREELATKALLKQYEDENELDDEHVFQLAAEFLDVLGVTPDTCADFESALQTVVGSAAAAAAAAAVVVVAAAA